MQPFNSIQNKSNTLVLYASIQIILGNNSIVVEKMLPITANGLHFAKSVAMSSDICN